MADTRMGLASTGLVALQEHLDLLAIPKDWPEGVCRNAFCGYWERINNGYVWHTPEEHP